MGAVPERGKWQYNDLCPGLLVLQRYYGSRIHYTPLWYPDNVDYPVAVCVFDAWTPGGQLYATMSGSIDIFDACLNDWYIHETDENG